MASQLQYITVNAAGFIESMLRIQAPSQQTEVKIKGYISHKKLDTTASSALSANFIDPLPTLPICEDVKSKSSTQLEKKTAIKGFETVLSASSSMNHNCFSDRSCSFVFPRRKQLQLSTYLNMFGKFSWTLFCREYQNSTTDINNLIFCVKRL